MSKALPVDLCYDAGRLYGGPQQERRFPMRFKDFSRFVHLFPSKHVRGSDAVKILGPEAVCLESDVNRLLGIEMSQEKPSKEPLTIYTKKVLKYCEERKKLGSPWNLVSKSSFSPLQLKLQLGKRISHEIATSSLWEIPPSCSWMYEICDPGYRLLNFEFMTRIQIGVMNAELKEIGFQVVPARIATVLESLIVINCLKGVRHLINGFHYSAEQQNDSNVLAIGRCKGQILIYSLPATEQMLQQLPGFGLIMCMVPLPSHQATSTSLSKK